MELASRHWAFRPHTFQPKRQDSVGQPLEPEAWPWLSRTGFVNLQDSLTSWDVRFFCEKGSSQHPSHGEMTQINTVNQRQARG